MKWSYHEAKTAAIHNNKSPTLTDQSAAAETDRNVIVHRFLQSGTAPGSFKPPMYGDLAELPEDLRGYINMARKMANARQDLPKELHSLSLEELLALTPEQLHEKLHPRTTKRETKETPNVDHGDKGQDAGLLPGTDGSPQKGGRSSQHGRGRQQPGDGE